VTTTAFENASCLFCVRGVYKNGNQGNDPIRLQVLEDIWRHDSLCHSGCGDGGNDVGEDVVLQTLLCECLCEPDLCKFGSYVVLAGDEIYFTEGCSPE
jgi:hypothetical protein